MWRCVNDIFGYCKTQPDGADKARPITREVEIDGVKQIKEVGSIGATCSLSPGSCGMFQTTEKPAIEESVIEKSIVEKPAKNTVTKQPVEPIIRNTRPKDMTIRMFDEDEYDARMQEWKDMPEYISEDITAFRTIQIHFHNNEGIREFAQLIKQKILPTTKYVWFPRIVIDKFMDKRYINEP